MSPRGTPQRDRREVDAPVALARALGSRSKVAREATSALAVALRAAITSSPKGAAAQALSTWLAARGAPKEVPAADPVTDWLSLPPSASSPTEALFALHSYAALIFKRVARDLIGELPATDDDPFDWLPGAGSPALATTLQPAMDEVARATPGLAAALRRGPVDLLKPLYHDLVPRRARRGLGEHYTPSWLAAHVLEKLGFPDPSGARLLDPACGSGTFLVHALARLRRRCEREGLPPDETLRALLNQVVGADRNPLAVLAAQVNYLAAVRDLLPEDRGAPRPPVTLADTLLDRATESPKAHFMTSHDPLHDPFDVVAGNPPWVNWQTLPASYRSQVAPLWAAYGLFPHRGFDALLGAANDDLAVLLSYAVTARLLRPGGRLGFVLPQSVLKTAAAGRGFRRLRFGDAPDESVRVDRVDDLADLPVFGSGSTSSCVVFWTRGAETRFPSPYHLWRRARPDSLAASLPAARLAQASLPEVLRTTRRIPCAAEPVDPRDRTSPWLTAPPDILPVLRLLLGPSDYRARVGVTTGGANAVFWLEVLEPLGDGLVRVRNLVRGAKRKVETITAPLEAELLYSLLRGRDVRRFEAHPSAHLLLTHALGDRRALRAYPEADLAARWPHAHAYLSRFQTMLRGRALYRRFFTRLRGGQRVETGPYYSLFDLGPYTAAPYKAVWHRMVTPVGAVLVGPSDDGRPVLPQEVHSFVGCDTEAEAAYLVGLLNATPFNVAALAYAQAGAKGFAAPHLLRHLRLPRFDPASETHQELSRLAVQMQQDWPRLSPSGRRQAGARLDHTAARVWDLSESALQRLQGAYETLVGDPE